MTSGTDRPVCSVVIPVFNGERFLGAALESVFAQSLTDFELLVIDDGSTDATPRIIAGFQADPRLKLLMRPHQGIVAALNAGLAAASTDLIVRLDADDMMAPNRLERQLAYMEANPTLGGAGSFYTIIDEFGRAHGTHESPLTSIERLNQYIDHGGNPVFPHPAMIFRRSVAISLGGYREEFRKCEDIDLFLRMLEAGRFILIQPEYLTIYRYHPYSETATSGREQFELNEFLFSNFRRRRGGLPELSLDEFKADLGRLPLMKKLLRESRFLSRVSLRRHQMAKLQDKSIAATFFLVSAAACDPETALKKLRRLTLSG